MADHAGGLAAHQLGHVRVPFLRHDRAAGAESIGDGHESESRARPDDELLGEAREMDHDQRRGGGEFDGEIPIRHGVE